MIGNRQHRFPKDKLPDQLDCFLRGDGWLHGQSEEHLNLTKAFSTVSHFILIVSLVRCRLASWVRVGGEIGRTDRLKGLSSAVQSPSGGQWLVAFLRVWYWDWYCLMSVLVLWEKVCLIKLVGDAKLWGDTQEDRTSRGTWQAGEIDLQEPHRVE